MRRQTKDGLAGWLTVIYRVLLVGLAPALYLSYFPVIGLAADATMNYELSVAVVFLVALDMVGVALLLARGEMASMVRRLCRRKWTWGFFPLMVTASAVWSLNAVRGWLTVLMMWTVIAAVVVIWELKGVMDEKWRRWWWRGFVGGTLAVCAWCMVQCVLDLLGASREVTGMCAGCVSGMFGFPHPNGFAIEPQFMGNLLLAPGIMTMMAVADGFKMHLKPFSAILFFTIVVATIFLTFSRGAIYAFVLAVGVLGIYYIVRRKAWKGVMMVWGVVVAAFLVVLNLQGLMAEVGPTNDDYATAVVKVIDHLTLGVVDLRGGEGDDKRGDGGVKAGSGEMEKADSSPSPSEVNGVAIDDGTGAKDAKDEAVFDGYVAESTETRVRMTVSAIAVWTSEPAITVAGVGIGGAGVAMHQAGLTVSPKEIVQNEYASLLLETGLIGVILAGVMVVSMMVMLVRRRAVVVLILMGAYGVTLMFFSGLPNALHIYIMPVLILAVGQVQNTSALGTGRSGPSLRGLRALCLGRDLRKPSGRVFLNLA